jgi:magnesium-transporting ATPase (P-type)
VLWRRFLVRLLLVHGTLADYRLGRLIKYSFYKNITFAFIFLFFQPFNGISGQVRRLKLAAKFVPNLFTGTTHYWQLCSLSLLENFRDNSATLSSMSEIAHLITWAVHSSFPHP